MGPSTIKLLAIDNQVKISDLDRKRYKTMGVQSTVVGSFAESEDKLSQGDFDMIVINYDDESINAAALAEHYKNSKDYGKMPIVATTVQSAEKAGKALKGHADLVIEFPIPGQQFVEKLRSLLDQQTRQHQRINQQFTATIALLPSGTMPVSTRKAAGSHLKAVTDTPQRMMASVDDMSSTGILLGTDDPLDIGSHIEVQLQLPGYKKPFIATGEVVRQVKPSEESSKPCASGVKFHGFKGDSEKRLKNYLTKQQIISSKISYYL